jgi:signal transduction histidine kinase
MKLNQIMYNLLSNAIKFTPENGNVSVHSKDLDGMVSISISDTGIGIPADKQNLIFDPFKQVDSSFQREHEGTGLGLALVQRYVEMHGGKIWVESEVGKGSTFSFVISKGNDDFL